MKHYLLLLLILAVFPCHAFSAEFSKRVWVNDINMLESQVLKPLAESFADQECQPSLGFYLTPYTDKLSEIRSSISSKSFLLFREIALTTAEEYHPFRDKITCQVVDMWSFFEINVRKKINLLGNTFAIME